GGDSHRRASPTRRSSDLQCAAHGLHLPVNRLDSALELRALLFKGRGEHWLSGHFDRAELVEVELPPVRSGGADGGTQTVFLDLRFDTPPHLAGSHPGSAAGTVLDSLGCGPD